MLILGIREVLSDVHAQVDLLVVGRGVVGD
jgi:hypothetical protein